MRLPERSSGSTSTRFSRHQRMRSPSSMLLIVRVSKLSMNDRRSAWALLGWRQDELARAAGIGLATLQRIEQNEGVVRGNFSTAIKIQKALEQAGIHFLDEDESGAIGVRLLKKKR